MFVHDSARVRQHRASILVNRKCLTLLPAEESDVVFNVDTAFTSGDTIQLGTKYGETGPTEVWGMRLYVLHSVNPALIHKSAVVRSTPVGGQYTLTDATKAELYGLQQDDIVGFSPVYFEWQGPLLGTRADDGTPIANQLDYFSVKHAETMGASFAGVTNPPLEDRPSWVARFAATIYRGTEATPLAKSFPTKSDGSAVASITDREGTYHAAYGVSGQGAKHGVAGTTLNPGLIIVAPSQDFELLGVRVQGRLLSSDRSRKQ